MYKRILLAYDGSLEGRSALRAGALVAARCEAEVFLLSVIPDTAGLRAAEGAHAGAVAMVQDRYRPIFDEAVARLKELGFHPRGKLVLGEPAQEIGSFAREVRADLVVVGHRRTNLLERWWRGASGAYLADHVDCSVLIARNPISDAEFMAEFEAAKQRVAANQS